MRNLANIILTVAMGVMGPSSGAVESAAGDIPGCHHDDVSDSYFCSAGPLAGREFLTKSEAEEALQTMREQTREREAQVEAPPPPPTGELPAANESAKAKDKTASL